MINVSNDGRSILDRISKSVSLKVSIAGLVLILLGALIGQGKTAGFLGIYGAVFFLLGMLGYGVLITIRLR